MKMNEMIISNIRVEDKESTVVLSAKITRNAEEFSCWFEYPALYRDYICTERSDAFIVSLLPYALHNSYNIFSDIPLSERLSYQIRNFYIPILSKYQSGFHEIEIKCPTNSKDYNKGKAVGTGISCGVDSFYSVLKNYQNSESNYNLTHLVTMNVGSFGHLGGDFSNNWFRKEIEKAKEVSDELKLPLIEINSNLMEFYMTNHAYSGTMRMVGAILGLQKLFSIYYISAGFDIKDFDICSDDNDDYDLFNLMIGSNESTLFYSTGIEATRYERTQYISDYELTYNKLTVCLGGPENCGRCEKCLRTIGTLYSIGKLDKYKDSFNLQEFNKSALLNWAKIRYYGIGYLKPVYKEIYIALKKENPIKYAFVVILAFLVVWPGKKLQNIVRKGFTLKHD